MELRRCQGNRICCRRARRFQERDTGAAPHWLPRGCARLASEQGEYKHSGRRGPPHRTLQFEVRTPLPFGDRPFRVSRRHGSSKFEPTRPRRSSGSAGGTMPTAPFSDRQDCRPCFQAPQASRHGLGRVGEGGQLGDGHAAVGAA